MTEILLDEHEFENNVTALMIEVYRKLKHDGLEASSPIDFNLRFEITSAGKIDIITKRVFINKAANYEEIH